MMKSFIKQFIPPIAITLFHQLTRNTWTGDYKSWKEAGERSMGYDSEIIFDKVKKAALEVHHGRAAYERDSVLFYKEAYNWNLLSCLLLAAHSNSGILHVTDFGGSLGSAYYQHKKLFSWLKEVKWGVVEQKHFVDFGKQHLATNALAFYDTIEECNNEQKPQVLLISGVLQYLEKPFELIEQLLKTRYEYLFLDKTALTKANNHHLTIQHVPEIIYKASYPAWFFNEEQLLQPFLKDYELLLDFGNDEYTNLKDTYYKGFFFKRKDL